MVLVQQIRLALRFAATALVVFSVYPTTASAQILSAGFAPGCEPTAGCATARFNFGAPVGGSVLNTLTFTFNAGTYSFLPIVLGGTVGTYAAQDDISPFSGFTAITAGGAQLSIDFLNTGDPFNPGFPFTLGASSSGYVEVDVSPVSWGAPFAFQFVGQLEGGGTISGAVGGPISTVPEPSTVGLLAMELLALGVGLVARGRRARA